MDTVQPLDIHVLDTHILVAAVLLEGIVIAVLSAACVLRSSRKERPDPQAEERAHTLLQGILTAEELGQLSGPGYLKVPSPSNATRVYHVPMAAGEMVAVYDSGRMIERLCLGPAEARLPPSDLVLMHKLMIEGNEERYLSEANAFAEGPAPM